MEIFEKDMKVQKSRCVIALGDFDGVHLGHRKLLDAAKKRADELNVKAGVYTFSVNSKLYLGAKDFALLTTDTEKNEIISSLGFDFVYDDDFSGIKDLSPEKFCDYLTEKFDVCAVCCGENYTFGKKASADSKRLALLMKQKGVECIIVTGFSIDNECVSSTSVRNAIKMGDMVRAEKLLGYKYFIRTKVIHGAKLGRKLGFPTINQHEYSGKAVPMFGVYACICTVEGRRFNGVVNVGIKPTVSGDKQNPPIVFETHILDYEGDLYGKEVTVEFCKQLRPERKFSSLDELHENVMKNIEETREYFAGRRF